MSNKDLFIIAFVGSDNLGDEAIFEQLAHEHLNRYPDAVVRALSRKTQIAGRVQHIPHWNVLSVMRALRQSASVTFGGGGLLQDESSALNVPYFVLYLLLARLCHRPIHMRSIGVSKTRLRMTEWLIRLSCRLCNTISVRDEESARLLSAFTSKPVNIDPDPVLDFEYDSSQVQAETRALTEITPDYTVISFRHWYTNRSWLPARFSNARRGSDPRYKELVKQLAEALDQHASNTGSTLVFVPFQGDRDRRAAADVIQQLNTAKATQPKGSLNPHDFVHLCHHARAGVFMRLHGVILASTTTLPFLAIDYSSKVGNTMRQLHRADGIVALDAINEIDEKLSDLSAVSSTLSSKSARA